MIEIRWHGRGGQGAVTSVELLALAAIEGRILARAKRCVSRARLRVSAGGLAGAAPRRIPGQWKAPRSSALSAPFAWSGNPSGT